MWSVVPAAAAAIFQLLPVAKLLLLQKDIIVAMALAHDHILFD